MLVESPQPTSSESSSSAAPTSRADAGATTNAGGAVTEPAVKTRAAVIYRVTGDGRFLAHHDEMRTLTRALIRARWPLAFSQGFNPQPRLSVCLPRRVATASDAQLALVGLSEAQPTDALRDRLTAQLPSGLTLDRVLCPINAKSLHPLEATYEVDLDAVDPAALESSMKRLLAQENLTIQRETRPGTPTRTVDIRPFVRSLSLQDATLAMTLHFEQQRTARPIELLAALGLDADAMTHRITLRSVRWDQDLTPSACDHNPEGNSIGQESQEDHHQT